MSQAEIRNHAKARKLPLFRRFLRDIRRHPALYVIFVLIMTYFILFCYWPMYGNIIAFQKYKPLKGIMGSKFVGFTNFEKFFTSYYFPRLVRNTLLISVYNLIFGFPFPIFFAILLNEVQHLRYKKVIQTITYLPHFISTMVICAMIIQFTNSKGFLTIFANSISRHEGALITDPRYFRSIYVVSGIWQTFGWNSILYIAAMTGISPDLYEAATIDGANKLNQMIHVTLPGIKETIVIMLIMAIGRLMNVGWEKAFLLQNEATYETSDIISTYVYRKGFVDSDYSYSTAVNIFNSVINLALLTTANYVSRRMTESSLW